MRQTMFISICVGLLSFGLSSFSIAENDTKTATSVKAPNGMTLEQTCGNQDLGDYVYLADNGITLIVKFSSSFRIDWTTATGGSRKYYSAGTTQVSIEGDRFTISLPGESGPNIQTYCFVIHRN